MKFLEKLNFGKDYIETFLDNTPDKIIEQIKNQKKLVTVNIEYLKDMGVTNYQDIFIKYNYMFLMDHSNFKEIFEKYDKADLVLKLNKNADLVLYL